MAFNIPNPNNYKEVDHIDSNPCNNILNNLRWANREIQSSNKNSLEKNMGTKSRCYKITIKDDNNNIDVLDKLIDACKKYDVSQLTIHKYSISGEKYKGYTFSIEKN